MSSSLDLEENLSFCKPWVQEGDTVWPSVNEMDLTREIPGDGAHHFRSHGERLRVRLRASPALARVGVKAGANGFPVMIPYWRL